MYDITISSNDQDRLKQRACSFAALEPIAAPHVVARLALVIELPVADAATPRHRRSGSASVSELLHVLDVRLERGGRHLATGTAYGDSHSRAQLALVGER